MTSPVTRKSNITQRQADRAVKAYIAELESAAGHCGFCLAGRCNCIDLWRIASGMSAGTAETQSGSGLQPASPTAEGGDAQGPSA